MACCSRSVEFALKIGYRHIDKALLYGYRHALGLSSGRLAQNEMNIFTLLRGNLGRLNSSRKRNDQGITYAECDKKEAD